MKGFNVMKRIWRNEHGVAALEFGVALPFLLLLFLGGVEFTRYIQLHQRLDKTNNQIADILSQAPNLTEADIAGVLSTVPNLLQPYDSDTTSHIVSLAVRDDADPAYIADRYSEGSGAGSRIGSLGGQLSIDGFTMEEGDEALIVETYYFYQPLLGPLLEELNFDVGNEEEGLYKRAVYRPRTGPIEDFD